MVRGMRIVVIGATGTIGSAVADALADRHEVVRASRNGPARVDVDDGASVDAFFAEVKNIDAVVSCATGTPARWQALFGPLDKLGEAQLTSLLDGLGAHVRFLLACCRHVVDGGSITVTTGALAHQPIPGQRCGDDDGRRARGLRAWRRARHAARRALLVLQRGQRGDRAEVSVERGRAHPGEPRDVVDAERLAVVIADPAHRAADLREPAVDATELADLAPLVAAQEPPQQLTLDEWAEHGDVAWAVEQADEPDPAYR